MRSGTIDVSVIDREIREYTNKTFNLIGRSKNNVDKLRMMNTQYGEKLQ